MTRRGRAKRPPDDGRMLLVEHIGELRSRLLKSVLAIVVGTILAFIVHKSIFNVLTHPYCSLPVAHRSVTGDSCALIVTGVLDAFGITLKVSLYAGLLLSSPVWLWQLWRFITPGLHDNERRLGLSFVAASVVLFAGGAVLAFVTLSKGLQFLLSFASGGITPALRVDSYISFVIAMVVIFGAAFEFPLLVVSLNFANVVSYQRLRAWRRAEVFGVFLFAAVATPSQDPFTMTAMAVPMCLLYEVALLFARAHDRRKARREAESPYAGLADDEISPLDAEATV